MQLFMYIMYFRFFLNEAFTTLMALWACKVTITICQGMTTRGARALNYHFGSNLGKVIFHIYFYSSARNYINIYPVCGQKIYSIEELHTEILKYYFVLY